VFDEIVLLPIPIFEVLTAVVMKSCAFSDITPFSLLKVNRRFGAVLPASCCFLLGLLFDPESGIDMFFRNVC
jgi:hypothetical protein